MSCLREFVGERLPLEQRFIPYVSMYEFEAFLFSNPTILGEKLNIDEAKIFAYAAALQRIYENTSCST